jgi:hypothetical protein
LRGGRKARAAGRTVHLQAAARVSKDEILSEIHVSSLFQESPMADEKSAAKNVNIKISFQKVPANVVAAIVSCSRDAGVI